MQILSKRESLWLTVSVSFSGAASAALQAVVLTPANRTIADLDWLSLLMCAGVAMFGGLVGTLYEVHKAAAEKREVNVKLQIQLDLLRAVVIALVVAAAYSHQSWPPDTLPASLAVAGMLGQSFLAPVLRAFNKLSEKVSSAIGGAQK